MRSIGAFLFVAVGVFAAPHSGALGEDLKVRTFFCDTEKAAVAFAQYRSTQDLTDEMASNSVNKSEGREACSRYIGFVNREVSTRRLFDGYVFRVTRYTVEFLDRRGPRDAWGAERAFNVGGEELRDL